MGGTKKPSAAELAQLADNRPDLLNVLVAYFVLEWQGVTIDRGQQPHGTDQDGKARRVPDYCKLWGTDCCLHLLLRSPEERAPDGPGYATFFCDEVKQLPT